jgi:enamine deaminase RidA (YjgF/YER057c/UK114 family)
MPKSPEARLAELGITLPEPAKPIASYIPAKQVGELLFIAGQGPFRDGKLIATGPVPRVVSLEAAQECARQCTLNGLAAARAVLGTLDRIRSVVRVGAFVQCEAGYADQPKVANGASDLLVQIFGDCGRHARAAVGSIALPMNIPVEIEFLFEVGGAGDCP